MSALTPLVKYRHIPCILPVAEVFQVPSLARYWRGAFVSQQCKSPIPKGEMKCLRPLALPRYKQGPQNGLQYAISLLWVQQCLSLASPPPPLPNPFFWVSARPSRMSPICSHYLAFLSGSKALQTRCGKRGSGPCFHLAGHIPKAIVEKKPSKDSPCGMSVCSPCLRLFFVNGCSVFLNQREIRTKVTLFFEGEYDPSLCACFRWQVNYSSERFTHYSKRNWVCFEWVW